MSITKITGKAGSLDELKSFGLNVPPHALIKSELQTKFFIENGLIDVINDALQSRQNAYDTVMSFLNSNKGISFPMELDRIYKDSFKSFGEISELGIVRSSAEFEDGELHSFAGMFSSIPFSLSSLSNFKKAVLLVWLSALKPEVVSYLEAKNLEGLIDKLPSCMNIIFQPLIQSEASGVLFSKGTNGSEVAEVCANYGSGELLNTLGCHQLELKESQTGFSVREVFPFSNFIWPSEKRVMIPGELFDSDLGELETITPYKSHLHFVKLDLKRRFVPCLGRRGRELLFEALHQLIKAKNGRNFEAEWVYSKGTLYFVQIRPITAIDVASMTSSGLTSIVGGEMSGEIKIWDRVSNKNELEGKIVAVNELKYTLVSMIDKLGGILTTSGSHHSHAAIICRELGTPVYKISKDDYQNLLRSQAKMVNGEIVYG